MAYSGLVTEYLGAGLLAARPATPSVGPGVLALYYATDTPGMWAWNGSAWTSVTGSGGGGASLSGSWDWLIAAQTGPIANNKVGLDNNTPSLATKIIIAAIANGGVKYAGFLRALHLGDAVLIWDGADSSRWGRWNVTGNAIDHTTWFEIPVTPQVGTGGEPNNNADVQVLLLQGGGTNNVLTYAQLPPAVQQV